MAGNTGIIANKILNRVAAEVGIAPVPDPISSTDPFFIQLVYLLNTAGEELMQAYPWELLVRSHQIITQAGDTGEYNMPSDFGYILNQTEWDRSNNISMGGPLSAQEWTYLKGRNLASNTLYASFRISQGKFNVFPTNPSAGLDLNFEYMSSHWVQAGDSDPSAPTYKAEVTLASDIPLFDKTLITRALKVKYLESGGFDTQKAQGDYNQIFAFLTGTDKGAPILNASGRRGGIRLLNGYNTPDTGFGV
tara:strand:- start:20882 stop:21628 length:747 start_codon:yes stop_codon:yes gene_type:complete